MSGKQLWEEIKNKNIDVFANTAKVHQYCNFVEIDPNKCYLTCKATAVLPALETTLGGGYVCSQIEKYILVERTAPSLKEAASLVTKTNSKK